MHAGLAELARRLAADGIATEYAQAAGEAIVAHVPGDAGPWLGELERYVRRVVTRPGLELWSVLHFVVPPLLPVAGLDGDAFARLLRAVGELLVVREDHRLEQHGLRCAAEALVERPADLQAVLAGAHALLAVGCDAGWLLQIAVPVLAAKERAPAAFAAARDAGYECVCSAYGGYNFPGDDPFHLQRIPADTVMLRMKNWLTVDPCKLSIPRYDYAAQSSEVALAGAAQS